MQEIICYLVICHYLGQLFVTIMIKFQNPIQGSSYVIVHKSDLCQCSISAGTLYIQENIVYCMGKVDTKIDFYYTVNVI